MEDDIELKSELEKVKEDIRIYNKEKEELSQKNISTRFGSLLKDGGINSQNNQSNIYQS